LYKTIAVLAVAVLAAGCTSVEHGKGAPDLKAQLLTVAELPAGWSIDNSNSGGDKTSTPSCLRRPLDSELHANAKADASFVRGSDFPWLNQGIAYFGDDATASAKLSTIAAILNGCKDLSYTSDGHKVTGSMGVMSFPNFGDHSQAWDMTLTAEGTTVGFDLVLMQKGAELEQLFYGDLGWLDVTELQTLAESAADKMP
jgi:hypothetical protein